MKSIKRSVLVCLIYITAMSTAASGQPDTPDQSKISLNGEWLFKTDLYNTGVENNWYLQNTDICDWETMKVPGNWDLKNEYADYVGKAWYRKTFDAPEEWQDKAVRLYFESVYNDVQVWLNGEHIGEHHVGFLPFWFDIQDRLNIGESNTIVLRVDNTFKQGAIWNWGGIRRPVWLEVTGKLRLETQHITAVPDLKEGTAAIDVEFSVSNQSEKQERIGYEIVVLREGKEIWRTPQADRRDRIPVAPGGITEQKISLKLPASDVKLWHFNDPNLYECELRLYKNGTPVHELSDRFGIRKFEVVEESIHLNGEAIRTVGFNLVPEDRTTGNTLPLWRIMEDVDMMKSLGANMARLSHLPLPEEFLDYLDEKGIMTFEEVSLWGKDKMVDPEHPLPKYWLEKMIRVKYNHPSIIGWSVGNEIGFVDRNPKVMDYVKSAIQQTKHLDPHRLAVYVSNSADRQEVDPVKFSDMILFNSYGNWSERVERVHELHPGKPIFMSEYGRHLNNENLNEGIIKAKELLDHYRGKSYMVGASLWTFNDYRSFWSGSETWTTPPSQNRTWGVVDVFRQKKRAYFSFKREYTPVDQFSVQDNRNGKAEIKLVPRGKLDIPAYTLKGYTLVWSVSDEKGNLLEGGIEDLPVIHPGDEPLFRNISWKASAAQQLRVDLLDPQQYSVRDTTIYFAPPDPPEIIEVHTANDRARIIFSQVDNASAYKTIYGQSSFSEETRPTINNYIEIRDLEDLQQYQIKVLAINNAGASAPTDPVIAQLDEDELPPIIRKTVPADGCFYVGYSVDRVDYMYEVEYGTSPGTYTKKIGLRNVGVLQVPGLRNGEIYYYRMRNRKQWGFASEWTHEIAVTPDGGIPADEPIVNGLIRQNDRACIFLEPVEKAIGYEVSVVRDNKRVKHKSINQSVIRHILLEKMPANGNYTIEIRAKNRYGASEPVTVQ